VCVAVALTLTIILTAPTAHRAWTHARRTLDHLGDTP
jgi:hypothetical protein